MDREFTVRKATLDDVETMVRLRHDMQVELGEQHHGTDPDAIIEVTRQYFIAQLTGHHFTGMLAEADGQIIGTGAFVIYDVPPSPANPSGVDAYILNMYTLPEWRGHGVARAVIQALNLQAYEEGARRVWLRASKEGKPAYERMGFESRDNYMQMFL